MDTSWTHPLTHSLIADGRAHAHLARSGCFKLQLEASHPIILGLVERVPTLVIDLVIEEAPPRPTAVRLVDGKLSQGAVCDWGQIPRPPELCSDRLRQELIEVVRCRADEALRACRRACVQPVAMVVRLFVVKEPAWGDGDEQPSLDALPLISVPQRHAISKIAIARHAAADPPSPRRDAISMISRAIARRETCSHPG